MSDAEFNQQAAECEKSNPVMVAVTQFVTDDETAFRALSILQHRIERLSDAYYEDRQGKANMNKKQAMTKIDDEVLARLPDGWFNPFDSTVIPHFIRCPEYRCERLRKLGLLEKRYVGTHPASELQYRKKPEKSAEELKQEVKANPHAFTSLDVALIMLRD